MNSRRSHEGEDEQDAGEDDEEDEDGEEEQEPIGFGAPPQEAATTAEGQSAGTITLPHGEFHEATSLPPFASRPPNATEPFHEIQSAEQHDDQG